MAAADAGWRDTVGLPDDGAGPGLLRRGADQPARGARRRRVGARRREVVGVGRGRPALRPLHRHGPHRSGRGRGQARAPHDVPDGCRHAGDRGPAPDARLRQRRRPARAHARPLHERPGAPRSDRARRGARLRGGAGAARAGAHPPLHARHRAGGAGAGADGAARAGARGVRPPARGSGRQPRHHRRRPHRDRDDAASLPQGRVDDGHGRRARGAALDQQDQGRGASDGPEGRGRGDADARRRRDQPGLPVGGDVDPPAHAALRRRAGRGPPPAGRAGRAAEHANTPV